MRILHKMASPLACKQETPCKIIVIPRLGAESRPRNRNVNWVPGGKSRAGGNTHHQGSLQTMSTMKEQVGRKPCSVSGGPIAHPRTCHHLAHLTLIPTVLRHLSLFLLNPYGCLYYNVSGKSHKYVKTKTPENGSVNSEFPLG